MRSNGLDKCCVFKKPRVLRNTLNGLSQQAPTAKSEHQPQINHTLRFVTVAKTTHPPQVNDTNIVVVEPLRRSHDVIIHAQVPETQGHTSCYEGIAICPHAQLDAQSYVTKISNEIPGP